MEFDFNTFTRDYIDSTVIKSYTNKVSSIKKKFLEHTKELEWYHMSEYVDNAELKEILKIAS